MKKIPFGRAVKVSKAFLTKHSADILTGFTACGVIITALETRKATLRAQEYLRVNGYDQANPDTQKVLKFEAAKNYILPVATGGLTIGAAVGANYINHKQIAGLAAACSVAETALAEHRDKLEELMGSNALTSIDDEINKERAIDILSNDEPVHETGQGNVLCVEAFLTGAKVRCSPDYIRKTVNEFNEVVNVNTYASYGEFLEMFFRGLLKDIYIPTVAYNMGYNVHQNGLLRLSMTSDIDLQTGEPYLVIQPSTQPVANYMDIF